MAEPPDPSVAAEAARLLAEITLTVETCRREAESDICSLCKERLRDAEVVRGLLAEIEGLRAKLQEVEHEVGIRRGDAEFSSTHRARVAERLGLSPATAEGRVWDAVNAALDRLSAARG